MTSHFRIEIKTLSKAAGQSAAAAGRYDSRDRHSDKSDLVSSGNVNMPGWVAGDVSKFWSAADQYERANGLVARRAILSFPNQLPSEARESYIREWLSLNVPNCPASWAIHDEPEADPRNPHVHILISERMNDGLDRGPELFFKRFNAKSPELGGCKKKDIGSNRKDWLSAARASWADILNKHLPADQQVSHLSNEERGLPEPQPKFGAKVLAAEKKGIRTKLVSSVIEDSLTKNKIRCLSFVDAAGKTVTFRSSIDKGSTVEIVGKPSRSKVIDLVKACNEKGWIEVELWGTDEFKALARAELARAGVKIKGENDEQNSTNDSGSRDRGGERSESGRSAASTQRPAPTSSTNEPDRGSGSKRDRSEQQADRDVAGDDRPARSQAREASSLDNLGDSRRADISDLAASYQPAAKPFNAGLQAGQGGSDMHKDLTYRAVQRQLAAMADVSCFEIGLFEQETGKMLPPKPADSGQVLRSISLLKRENARGNNIFIRPARASIHPYVLIDDLKHEQIAELSREGFVFSLLIETSPNNHQVLIKLPRPTDADGRKLVERAFQKRLGSDIGCADGQHYFRLSGFTNRKPKHQQNENGLFPYVRVKQSTPSPTHSQRALEWLAIAPKLVDLPDEPERVIETVSERPEWAGKKGELAETVARSHLSLQVKYGAAYDPSIADFQVAKTLIKQGWNLGSVRDGLRDGSPDLLNRKVGHVDDYLDRTLAKVTGRPVGDSPATAQPDPGDPSRSPRPRPR